MKTKTPIFHLIILFLLLVFFVFIFIKLKEKILITNMLQSEVNVILDNQSRLDRLTKDLPLLKNEIGVWSKTLPRTEGDVAVFASTVEKAARDQGLVITLHFDDFPEVVGVLGLKVPGLGSDVVLEGSFAGVTKFISTLSELPYYFKIDKLIAIKSDLKHGVKVTLSGILMMSELETNI